MAAVVETGGEVLLVVAVDFPKAGPVGNENEGAEVDALGKAKLGAEAAEEVIELELEALRNENPCAADEAGGVVIELDTELDDDAPAKLEKEGAADEEDENEPNRLEKDGAADDAEAPKDVEEKLGVDVPKEDDPNKLGEEKGELTAVVVVELEDEPEEAPKMLLPPNVELEPNKLVVVAVVPLELELEPNNPDPPNVEVPAGDDVPNNVEPVAEAEGAPKPKVGDGAEGAADDGVEDEEDENPNPNEEVDDADEEGAPHVGVEDVDEPNSEGDEAGFENENGDADDDDDANENGDEEDDDEVAGLVEKENPDIFVDSLSVESN